MNDSCSTTDSHKDGCDAIAHVEPLVSPSRTVQDIPADNPRSLICNGNRNDDGPSHAHSLATLLDNALE
jgi:hypothetical protein